MGPGSEFSGVELQQLEASIREPLLAIQLEENEHLLESIEAEAASVARLEDAGARPSRRGSGALRPGHGFAAAKRTAGEARRTPERPETSSSHP